MQLGIIILGRILPPDVSALVVVQVNRQHPISHFIFSYRLRPQFVGAGQSRRLRARLITTLLIERILERYTSIAICNNGVARKAFPCTRAIGIGNREGIFIDADKAAGHGPRNTAPYIRVRDIHNAAIHGNKATHLGFPAQSQVVDHCCRRYGDFGILFIDAHEAAHNGIRPNRIFIHLDIPDREAGEFFVHAENKARMAICHYVGTITACIITVNVKCYFQGQAIHIHGS